MTTDLINQETLKFFIDHLEGIAGSISAIISMVVLAWMIQEKRESSREKRIEIYMDLSDKWDTIWATITSFPQKNKDLFKMDISEISDENQRLHISNAVHLLSRVFYYYTETRQDIRQSDWHKTVKYVFSKKVFYSIYNKHQDRYSLNFRNYIKEVRSEHKAQNVIEMNIKKEDKAQR